MAKKNINLENDPVLPSVFKLKVEPGRVILSWNESKANFDLIEIKASVHQNIWKNILIQIRKPKRGVQKLEVLYGEKFTYRLRVKKRRTWSEYLDPEIIKEKPKKEPGSSEDLFNK